MAGYSNRGGSGPAPIIVTNPTDEITSFEAATPPALVEPTDVALTNGITLRIGKPQIIHEMYYDVGNFPVQMEMPDVHCWYHSGHILVLANLVPDNIFNYTDTTLACYSPDFGQTWTKKFDVNGFNNGGSFPRMIDAQTNGRIMEWYHQVVQDPAGQERDFKFLRRGYWALTSNGPKYVSYPDEGTIRGLPFDLKRWDSEGPGYDSISRTVIYEFIGACRPCRLADGSLIMVAATKWQGLTYWPSSVLRSTDEGKSWTYISQVTQGEALDSATEYALLKLPDNRILCVMRNDGTAGEPARAIISTDATATSWGTVFTPGNPSGSASTANTMATISPGLIRLENGITVCTTGRVGNYISVCGADVGDGASASWRRYFMEWIHDAHEDAGGVNMAGASALPGKIVSFFGGEFSFGMPTMAHVAPNRIFYVYDHLPDHRNPIGTSYAIPARIYGMHVEIFYT